jgi:hypothetical protein
MSELAQKKEELSNEIMQEEGLKGKPIMDKIFKIIDNIGFDKEKVKEEYYIYKQKEDFADEVMAELGIKGRANRIKIMRIVDTVGRNKKKIKTSFLRSTIASRITHD